jgi:hypothetical protein
VNSMHEELENFERKNVWVLVEPPPNCKPIETKWVWKNKERENGELVRNKSRLVLLTFLSLTIRLAQTATAPEMLVGACKHRQRVHTSSNGARERLG